MKNTFKKIGALVLVLVMMLAMSATAFADPANMTGQAGVIGEFTTPDTPTEQDTSVIIYKEITAYNPETCTVNAPTVTFNYTIGAGDAGMDIYDANSHHDPAGNVHVQTKAGVGTPTITGTAAGELALVPGTNTLKASANGTANRFPLTVSFAGIDFTASPGTGAGVYRYVINETTTEAVKNASGIKEGAVANTLYLDVYVDGSGKIYGYVLFTNDVTIDARVDDATAATTANKIEGFVGSKPNEGTYDAEADSVADKYYTFNLEVSKDVVNDAFIEANHHEFPFTVILANSQVTAEVLPIITTGQYTTQTAVTAPFVIGTTIWNPTIGDSGVVSYVGIPCGTEVTIKETNDVVGVTYASKSDKADSDAAVKNIFTGEESNYAIISCGATALAKAIENHTAAQSKLVLFTNTLLQISPTGVVMRVAPYVLILAAGVVLLLISRKRRSEEEA